MAEAGGVTGLKCGIKLPEGGRGCFLIYSATVCGVTRLVYGIKLPKGVRGLFSDLLGHGRWNYRAEMRN
ncbi:MAG: hypothetical protein D6719_01840 [Candidatus Dadabacteria bacterium]|nr:MAG: hypothetical protein D6719_01840 [Candidatus Dadabacteria bacterium]